MKAKKPKILITSYARTGERLGKEMNKLSGMNFNVVSHDYSEAIMTAGGLPYVLPPIYRKTDNKEYINEILADFDGILLSGGSDIDPYHYGQCPAHNLGPVDPERDLWELTLLRSAIKKDIPVLGICRGFQLINTFFGGSIHQDYSEVNTKISHMALMVPRDHPTHEVKIKHNTILSNIYSDEKLRVNSYHHQIINDLGKNLEINAISQDGIIEGIEGKKNSYLLGIQWHPEMMFKKDQNQLLIFEDFVKKSSNIK